MFELKKINGDNIKDQVVDFIKKSVEESNSQGLVIGLSGGLDSTVVACLSTEAIGSEKILGIHMPTSSTPNEDREHARLIAKILNIKYYEIDINKLSSDFIETISEIKINESNEIKNMEKKLAIDSEIGKKIDNDVQKTAEGNLNARIRMIILYYYANLNNLLVAGTSNKSELLIGYFTKYGDGSSDILPIANIYKSQLKKLAIDWKIPEKIINKPPRAGLWPGQNDENEIGFTYNILDKILYLIVDKKLTNEEVLKKINVSHDEINAIRNRVKNNKHKLQFPPSPLENEKLF